MQLKKEFTDSSQVREIEYNNGTMEVLFVVGKRYAYYDVPEDVFEKALSAESIGKFINSEIKNKYKFELM